MILGFEISFELAIEILRIKEGDNHPAIDKLSDKLQKTLMDTTFSDKTVPLNLDAQEALSIFGMNPWGERGEHGGLSGNVKSLKKKIRDEIISVLSAAKDEAEKAEEAEYREAEPRRYFGVYSPKAEKQYGSAIYLDKEGHEVTVTDVYNSLENIRLQYAWDDYRPVGELSKFIQQHVVGVHPPCSWSKING
jgi:hypothetical protein